MKKTFIFPVLLLFTVNAFSQAIPSNEFSKEYYLQKSKSQKSTGWILLGGGAALAIIGLIGFSSTFDIWDSSSESDSYGYLMLGGSVISLASIPMFISSGKNNRKAATISLNNQSILVPKQGSLVQNSQPSLSLKITF
jgi:hypothetical protein